MNLVLNMPFVDRAVGTARLAVWHKHPGDAVVAGDAVCDLAVEEVETLRRDTSADRLVRGRRGRRTSTQTRRLQFHVRLVASEPAVVTEHRADVGALVAVGEALAVLTHGQGGGATSFRVVPYVLDAEVTG